ncbi:MAG: hypothetical protein AAGM38_14520, partial [Pseudomonadota bacterium]
KRLADRAGDNALEQLKGAARLGEAEPGPHTPRPAPQRAVAAPNHTLRRFEDIVALIRDHRDAKLLVDVEQFVRPGPVGPSSFEFTPASGAPSTLAATLGERLRRWTGARWFVSVAEGHDGPTLGETRAADEARRREAALAHPLVQAALAAFPGAELTAVRRLGEGAETPLEEDALFETAPDQDREWGDQWEPDFGPGGEDELEPPPGESHD